MEAMQLWYYLVGGIKMRGEKDRKNLGIGFGKVMAIAIMVMIVGSGITVTRAHIENENVSNKGENILHTPPTWSYDLNGEPTKQISLSFDGSHTISARSYDRTDYSEIDSVSITVSNEVIVLYPPWEELDHWRSMSAVPGYENGYKSGDLSQTTIAVGHGAYVGGASLFSGMYSFRGLRHET
ncbi:MAG TPA: hypothetical protein ENI53_00010 [Thermoplasmatales archaeon]|nr:hypothetical protein [Thermoplasmatales archaeon]